MASVTKFKSYTFEDFCSLVKDSEKADLIDGVIHMASPENRHANRLFMWLGGLVDLFVETLDLGEVFGSRFALRLGDKNGPEPDIAFVRTERLRLVQEGYMNGPADLVMEIVSPESIVRDYQTKRTQYEQARVSEYWIIDELKRGVTLLRLGADGKYKEVRPRKGELHSRALLGFWIRPEWLWQTPRQKKMDVLRQILAEQK